MTAPASLKAQKLRTVIISLDDLADVRTALNLLMNGQPLTAVQSGLAAEEAIANLTLIGTPRILFDGFKWNVFLFTTTG